MSKNRKKKRTARPKTGHQSPHPHLICGWCGERIRPGEESDNLYEPDEAYADRIPTSMAHVHKTHVALEDHPLYDQMPHIVFTGLPDELADTW